MKKKLIVLGMCMVMSIGLVACGGTSASRSTDKKSSGKSYKIGFTDNYNGNSYHQSMEKFMQGAADKLIADGEMGELTIVEANQDSATQISQIQDFVMQGYDLIVIDPCSTSSLNSAVEEATEAGIPCLIINDGPIDYRNELVYQLNFDFKDLAYTLTKEVCEQIGGSGNIIELRGTAGTTCDTDMHQGVLNALKEYPNVKIVAEIYTDWTGSKAQSELNSVLPTLGKVDGLVTQGGDAYAAVQAFVSANYTDLPIIAGDNRGSFLSWWATEAPEGYKTISGACNPWDGAMAMYIAVDILNGREVVNDMNCPFGYVYADDVDKYANMAEDDVASTSYEWDVIRSSIEAGK